MPNDNDKGDPNRKGGAPEEIKKEGKGESFKRETENFVQMNERREGRQGPALDGKTADRKEELEQQKDTHPNKEKQHENEKGKDKEKDRDK